MTSSMINVLPLAAEGESDSQIIAKPAFSGTLDEEEIEAGALLILACMAGRSFARMWKPGMNEIPHSAPCPARNTFWREAFRSRSMKRLP